MIHLSTMGASQEHSLVTAIEWRALQSEAMGLRLAPARELSLWSEGPGKMPVPSPAPNQTSNLFAPASRV
jgi:hypothetical protein